MYPYLPEMIESFNVPTDAVPYWAGLMSAAFSLSQAVTGIAWGRASDRFGRKPTILCGMTCIMSTLLLFGFSRSLTWAIVTRCLAGASNGNVGIIRTTVAEMVPEKVLQPMAFSIMPLVWTIGSMLGPGFGGSLANAAVRFPNVFGKSTFFKTYPFALPNIVASGFFLISLLVGFLYLKETLESKRSQRDYGRTLGQLLLRPLRCVKPRPRWLAEEEQASSLLRHSQQNPPVSTKANGAESQGSTKATAPSPPTYREVFSRQSNLNLLTYSLLALHSIAYDQLLPVFMHYPPQTNRSSDPNVHLPLKFYGGFGIDSDRIGLLFVLYAVVGMFFQFVAFPPLARHFGVLPCLKAVTAMFPIIYMITPFTALFPTTSSQQIALFAVMVFKCWAAIISFPCTTILLTNSAVSLRVLGTLNGVSVSLSSLGRAAGPAIGGWAFSAGVDIGYGILPWWILAGFALLGAISPWWLIEMEGFGGAKDSDDDNPGGDEGEALMHDDSDVEDDEQERSQPDLIGDGLLAKSGEDDNDFSHEVDEAPLSSSIGHK